MQDMANNELQVGDVVADSRGKLYRINETAPSFQRVRVAEATEMKRTKSGTVDLGGAYVRLYSAVRVDAGVSVEDAIAAHSAAWRDVAGPAMRAEIANRRKRSADSLPRELN